MATPKVTLKNINKVAAEWGLELVRGNGYFYWVASKKNGDDRIYGIDMMGVYVYRLDDMDWGGWMGELKLVVEKMQKMEPLKTDKKFKYSNKGTTVKRGDAKIAGLIETKGVDTKMRDLIFDRFPRWYEENVGEEISAFRKEKGLHVVRGPSDTGWLPVKDLQDWLKDEHNIDLFKKVTIFTTSDLYGKELIHKHVNTFNEFLSAMPDLVFILQTADGKMFMCNTEGFEYIRYYFFMDMTGAKK